MKPDGEVKVTAGKTVSQRSLVQFLEINKSWLQKNLKKINEEKNRFPKPNFQEGELLLFLGCKLPLEFEMSKNKRYLAKVTSKSIKVYNPNNANRNNDEVREALKNSIKNLG